MTSVSPTILGISAFYHDSAASLVQAGEIVAAAQEERFSRKKHDPRFPKAAINYCLEQAFIEGTELDAVAFYDNPLLTLDRVVKSGLAGGTRSLEQLTVALPSILGAKLWVEDAVRDALGSVGAAGQVLFAEHHMSHAASAFYPSPFASAAVLTIDGVGEWATTALGRGAGRELELFSQIDYPHSLGLLYSAFTSFCGFKVNSGEYKLMGLAPYGEPRYASLIREHLIDIRTDGSYRLNTEYFGYVDGLTMTNDRFHALFGGGPRLGESRITRREMDLAASIQQVTEDVVLRLARHLRAETGERNLVMAGGVALNCVANGKIVAERIFDHVWIQPAAGDAGGSLGAALLVHHQYFDQPRLTNTSGRDAQRGSYLGPEFSAPEVAAFLKRGDIPAQHIPDGLERARLIADALAAGRIVGYFAGRMEFGPRSLGARSILGDPRRTDTQSVMNLKIKFRESFRPFAPAVLANRAADYFELNEESPYMLLVAPVVNSRRIGVESVGDADDMLAVINQPRSDVPAVTHVDYSARIQTVTPHDHPEFYSVLQAFEARTGCPVLVNTSFNVRGEPIVGSPRDAYRCFMRSGIDLLVLGEYVLEKSAQRPLEDDTNWQREYELD